VRKEKCPTATRNHEARRHHGSRGVSLTRRRRIRGRPEPGPQLRGIAGAVTERAGLGDFRRQAEVSQDPVHHGRLLNQRDEAQSPTATRTGRDVDAKCPAHQLGPLIRAGPGGPSTARVLV
jgi:hypothetical protein